MLIAHLKHHARLSCTANTLDALKQRISDKWCVPLPPANSVPEDASVPQTAHHGGGKNATVLAVIAALARVEYDPLGVYRHALGMSLEASSDLLHIGKTCCSSGRDGVRCDLPACTVRTCGNPDVNELVTTNWRVGGIRCVRVGQTRVHWPARVARIEVRGTTRGLTDAQLGCQDHASSSEHYFTRVQVLQMCCVGVRSVSFEQRLRLPSQVVGQD